MLIVTNYLCHSQDLIKDIVGKMEKEKSKTEEDPEKKEASTGAGQVKDHPKDTKLTNGDSKKPGGRRLVIEEVENDGIEEEEEEESDSTNGLRASDTNAVNTGTGQQNEVGKSKTEDGQKPSEENFAKATGDHVQGTDGTTETDGCIGSKPKSDPSLSSQVSDSEAAAGYEQEEKVVEPALPPKPTPPPPAPPLPDSVVFLKDAGNDFFKKGQYTDAQREVHQSHLQNQERLVT